MPLVQLIYISKSVGPTVDKDPASIKTIQARNQSNNITSIILTDDHHHLHVIEGGRAAVNALYNRIVADVRHTDCNLLKFYEITRREFADFSAEVVSLSSFCYVDSTDTVFHLADLDPHTITPAKALTMLRRVAAYRRVVRSSE